MAAELHSSPTVFFWIGRAGSGKTIDCLRAIASELNERPRGAPLILLVPEQATAQMERRLAALVDQRAGFTRARVFSFTHLMREALTRFGGAPENLLGPAGRIMLMRRALREKRSQLKIFKTGADASGFAECLSEGLSEFEISGWSPESIADWLERSAHRALNARLAAKLRDFHLIWTRYSELLAETGLRDPAEHIRAALRALAGWDWLERCLIWIDGFFSFTGHESQLIEVLGRRAEQLVLSFTADPVFLDPGIDQRGPGRRSGSERLFENIEHTINLLSDRFGELSWPVQTVSYPPAGAVSRSSAISALVHLENKILGRLRPEVLSDSAWNACKAPFAVGSSRVDLQACKLEYSIVSPK